eukprot:GHUV01028455.1.p1 GENE.GHUV01028455.1~~GHUV01028455.1.p1  ORF type:complete len:398 (+),score=120.36 GHUV01028455.1:1175-2368(+)
MSPCLLDVLVSALVVPSAQPDSNPLRLAVTCCTVHAGVPHPRGTPKAAEGKRPLGEPIAKDGRKGLFGLLQGTEAGGVDCWVGNPLIDPTKGKRAVSAPSDEKRTVSMTQLLAQTTPGLPTEDAWLGNISIDPAKGKGHAADPSTLRGRSDLFAVMQQKPMSQNGSKTAAEADAWIGNRLIEPNKGKKPVELPDDAQDHLHAATFKNGPAPDGCWSDMPPVGKRPLDPPSNAAHFVNAAQTMRILDPLPPGTVVGSSKPRGKEMIPDPYHNSSKPEHVDMYKLMTYQPLSEGESSRYQQAWNDAAQQPKKKPIAGAAAAASDSKQLEWRPNKAMRYVPYGGIAQEAGMTLDTIVTNRNQFDRASGGSSGGGAAGSSTGSSKKQGSSTCGSRNNAMKK